MVFHNSLQSRVVLVTATLTFERYEYSPPVDPDGDENCLVSEQGQCTVGIPYSTGSQTFLSKGILYTLIHTCTELPVDIRKLFAIVLSLSPITFNCMTF